MPIMCACLQEESYKDARPWIEVPQMALQGWRHRPTAVKCRLVLVSGIISYLTAVAYALRTMSVEVAGKDVGRII
jgi:hypothetical protein